MKHPSLKIFVIAIICIVTIAGVMYSKYGKNKENLTNNNSLVVTTRPAASVTTVKELQAKVENPADTSTSTESTTLTDKLSREFAANYINLQGQGKWDIDNQALLIENIASTYASTTSKSLLLSDISTFSDKDTNKTKAFGNVTAQHILNYYPTLKNSPIDILSNAANSANGSTTLKSKLAPISKAYRMLVLDLVKVPVPASLAANYLAVINGYIYLADDVDNMSFYFDDPVKGFLGLNNYQKNLINQADLLKNIATYFNNNGILFTTSESGNIWSGLIN